MAECASVDGTVVGAVALSSLPGSQHLRTLALTAYWRVQEVAGEERTDSEEARADLHTPPPGTLLRHLGHTDTTHYNTPCILTLNTTNTPSVILETGAEGSRVLFLQVPVSGVLVASPVPGDPCRLVVLAVAPYGTHPIITPSHSFTTPTHTSTTTPTNPPPPALVLALTAYSVLKLDHLLAILDKLNPDLRQTRLTSVSVKPPPKPLRLSQRKLSNQLGDNKTPPSCDEPPPLAPKRKHKPEGISMGQESAQVELQRHKEEETGMEKHELKGHQHQKHELKRDQHGKHKSKEDQHEKRVNDELEILRQRGEEARAGRYGVPMRGQCGSEQGAPTEKVRMRGQDTPTARTEEEEHGQTVSPSTTDQVCLRGKDTPTSRTEGQDHDQTLSPTTTTTVYGHYPLRGTLSVSRAQDCHSGIYDQLGPPRSVGENHGDGKNAT